LLKLYLAGNRFVALPANLFQMNSGLQYLDLSSNLLAYLNKTMFSSNTLLETIKLNNNKLNAVDKLTFRNLTQLSTLLLSNNICIDTDFTSKTPINATSVMNALSLCDANANPTCKGYASHIKSLATALNATLAIWQNVSIVLNQLLNIPIN
jgi:Leucine-rich repeat (LRR) protein